MFILLFGWVHKCHHCKIFNFFNFSLDTENFCYVQHIVLQSFLLKVFCILNFNSTDKLNTPWKLWILREFCHKVFANSSINKSWIDALVTIGFSYLRSEWVSGFFRIKLVLTSIMLSPIQIYNNLSQLLDKEREGEFVLFLYGLVWDKIH